MKCERERERERGERIENRWWKERRPFVPKSLLYCPETQNVSELPLLLFYSGPLLKPLLSRSCLYAVPILLSTASAALFTPPHFDKDHRRLVLPLAALRLVRHMSYVAKVRTRAHRGGSLLVHGPLLRFQYSPSRRLEYQSLRPVPVNQQSSTTLGSCCASPPYPLPATASFSAIVCALPFVTTTAAEVSGAVVSSTATIAATRCDVRSGTPL